MGHESYTGHPVLLKKQNQIHIMFFLIILIYVKILIMLMSS